MTGHGLSKRLAVLERSAPAIAGPQVIVIMAHGDTVPSACLIVANRHGKAGHAMRQAGEPDAQFLARVEAERVRLHGGKR